MTAEPNALVVISNDATGNVETVDVNDLARGQREKPARNIFDEPFAQTVKQIEAWWPTRRRD